MRILSRIKIKVLAFCLLITLVLLSFTGCRNYLGHTRFKKYAPDRFPNTVWAAENGEIRFHVEESEILRYKGTDLNVHGDPLYSYIHASVFGEINKGEEKYDVFIIFGYADILFMEIISEEIPEIGELGKESEEMGKYKLVVFELSDMSEKHFRATVLRSSIYEEGTVFDFYRQE